MLTKVAFVAALGGALMLPAVAADVQGEITTAATHAQLAGQATDVDMVHMHLHHVVNCLVGRSGQGFDPTNINPCAGSGTGAIPDETDPAKKQQLTAALTTAEQGISSNDMNTARQDANSAYMQLQETK